MNKNKDQKRKAQLEQRAKNESFRFQVLYAKKFRLPELPDDDETLTSELNALCAAGLGEAMLAFGEIIRNVSTELSISQEAEKNTLNGTMVPYILGITECDPLTSSEANHTLTNSADIQLPLQVAIAYDNEVRNKVVDWLNAKGYTTTTRLAQPIIKLPNMIVEVKRVVK